MSYTKTRFGDIVVTFDYDNMIRVSNRFGELYPDFAEFVQPTGYMELELTVQVSAEFSPYRPATYTQPAEGGLYELLVYFAGDDITDLLDEYTIAKIEEYADEYARDWGA